MSNFPECILQVLEMQDGSGITNVYSGICGARVSQRRKAPQKAHKEQPVVKGGRRGIAAYRKSSDIRV